MNPLWRNVLIVAGVVVLILIAASAWVAWATSRDVESPLMPMGGTGSSGRALIVYHPGLSDFPDRVTGAFAAGLVQAGWRVDRTTASGKAPDLAGHDLLVLGSPVYGNAAAAPLTRYLTRLGDLQGKPVVLVFSAAGDARPALEATARQAEAQHGRLLGRHGYTTQKPNEARAPQAVAPVPPASGAAASSAPSSNLDLALALARDAGAALRAAPR